MPDELWLPSRFTKPLSEDYPTRGHNLIRFAELAWATPENPRGVVLDEWQRDLICRALEEYPAGHPLAGELRYRIVIISMPRQQGKSLIGSLFALWGLLMHVEGPYVLSIASTSDQAKIVYNRVLYTISNNPELKALFAKTTETRGIRTSDGSGTYEVKAAKGAALQGLPVSLCVFDELHISKPELMNAVIEGMKTRTNGLVIGITTAGDSESILLTDLYARGAAAIDGGTDERFGFFVWEAPDGCKVDDPEAIVRSNPAVAAGRITVDRILEGIKGRPEEDVRRYTLNQFVRSTGGWMPSHLWNAVAGEGIPAGVKPTFVAVDRTHDWKHSTIVASVKHEGKIYTDVIRKTADTDLNLLEQECLDLRGPGVTFVLSWNNKALAERLSKRGLKVEVLTGNGMNDAASTAFAQIARQNVCHDGSAVVVNQLPYVVRKNVGSGYKIVPVVGSHIEAVYAQVMAIYAAETFKERGKLLL